MTQITINSLQLEISGAAGHEHRVHDIVSRATEILGISLGERWREATRPFTRLDAILVPALDVDLDHTGDEQVARQIAGACFAALAPHLKV
jgi:hypothetical protein